MRRADRPEAQLSPGLEVPFLQAGRRFGARERWVQKLVLEKADEVARRHGIGRREFLRSAAGAATTLWAINLVSACAKMSSPPAVSSGASAPNAPSASGGQPATGGAGTPAGSARLDAGVGPSTNPLPTEPPGLLDPSPICAELGMRDVVVDMQVNAFFVEANPLGIVIDSRVYRPSPETFPWLEFDGPCTFITCYEIEGLARIVFEESDTTIAFAGTLPHQIDENGSAPFRLGNDRLLENVALLAERFPERMHALCAVMPDDRHELQLDMMDRLASRCAGWEIHTGWSPTAQGGVLLTEGMGPQIIARGIDLGKPLFVLHKGQPYWGQNPDTSSPRDIGPIARMFPEAQLVVANAAFEHGMDGRQTSAPDLEDPTADLGWGPGVGEWPEGPYDEEDEAVQLKYPLARGTNALIRSLRQAGIGRNGFYMDGSPGLANVYASCGAAWGCLIPRPEEAMHFWGKLLFHVGEDRLVWGTESPWFGSAQHLIDAFRAFQISEELQERFGYPALTAATKAKILGNGARLVPGQVAQYPCHEDYLRLGPIHEADAG